MKLSKLLIISATLLLLGAGCASKNAPRSSTTEGSRAQPQSGADIRFPETGTPSERLRVMWTELRPMVERDAKANYTYDEYLKRGELMSRFCNGFNIEVSFMYKSFKEGALPYTKEPLYISEAKPVVDFCDEEIDSLLLDYLYGSQYYTQEANIERRNEVKANLNARLQEIDKKIKELK